MDVLAIKPGLRGVLPMLVTPFGADGVILFDDLDRLVEDQVRIGVHGLAALGLFGEASRLTTKERIELTRRVLTAVADRVPVIIGTSSGTTSEARQLTEAAAAAGAAAVMVAPPVSPGIARDALLEHYTEVARAAAPCWVMVQDAPAFVGVSLDADFIRSLASECVNVRYAKTEAVPVGEKTRELAAASPDVGIFAGLAGLNCVEALDAGAQGLIAGCELSETWLSLCEAHGNGDRKRALEIYTAVLPLIAFMMQSLDFGIACSKELLRRKGILSSASLRTSSPLGAWSLSVLQEHAQAIEAFALR